MKVHFRKPIVEQILRARLNAEAKNASIDYIDLEDSEWDDLMGVMAGVIVGTDNLLFSFHFRNDCKRSPFDNSSRFNTLYAGIHVKLAKAELV